VAALATTLLTATLLAAIRSVFRKRLRQFGLRQAFLVGRELLDHLRRDFVCRRRILVFATRPALTAALSTLATTRSALTATTRLRVVLATLSTTLTATTGTGRTMRPQSFECLRQFTLFKFAVLVRIVFFHQLLRQLFGSGALMLSSLSAALATALTTTLTAAAAFAAAGTLCIRRQTGSQHQDRNPFHRRNRLHVLPFL
jgi:hypothetical protein